MFPFLFHFLEVDFFDRLFSKPPYLFLFIYFYLVNHLYFFYRLFSKPSLLFIFTRHPKLGCHTIYKKKLKLCIKYRARHYFIAGRCSTLKASSLYIHLVSNLIMFSYMFIQAQQTQERHGSTRTYQEKTKTCIRTYFASYFIAKFKHFIVLTLTTYFQEF